VARGLLSGSQTKVIFRQPSAQLSLVWKLCRLGERKAETVVPVRTVSIGGCSIGLTSSAPTTILFLLADSTAS